MENVLKEISANKIEIIYHDVSKQHQIVNLDFCDESQSFISFTRNINSLLPEVNTGIDIIIYSSDGIYQSTAKVVDITMTMSNVTYELITPKNWEFIQRRKFLRKKIHLPVTVEYKDGFSITGLTNNLSAGGFSMFYKEQLPSIYTKLNASAELFFPKNALFKTTDGILKSKVKFIYIQENIPEHDGEKLIAYKFTDLDKDIIHCVKHFIDLQKI